MVQNDTESYEMTRLKLLKDVVGRKRERQDVVRGKLRIAWEKNQYRGRIY
jgi:hypothetical protein